VSTRRAPAPCPYCGRVTDADSQFPTDEDAVPGPGDVSVCFYCAGIALYTETGFRKPTDEERAELLDEPDVIATAAAILGYRAEQ
jgi:hypothetical protein